MIYLVLMVRAALVDVPKSGGPREALMAVRPFFAMMLAGFTLYATMNAALLIGMAVAADLVVDKTWNDLAVEVFAGLVLIPASFAFSIRMFPLYLRLPVVDWHVGRVADLYFVALCLHLFGALPSGARPLDPELRVIGDALRGVVVLWVIWKLGVLTRRRPARREHSSESTGIPGVSAFGRFDRHLVAAYVWLAIAAALEIVAGLTSLIGHPIVVRPDVLRHVHLLGFVTNLILGMAPRLIPGFLGRRRIALPALVSATFWLANTAAFGRMLYLVLPARAYADVAAIGFVAQAGYAFSGTLGLAAVVALALNLRATARAPGNGDGG